MKISRVYSEVQNGNYSWTLWMSEEKNKNVIRIHDQNMGMTIYENDEVWDSDLFKIVRELNKHQYDRTNIKDMLMKINRVSRHLEIPTYLVR